MATPNFLARILRVERNGSGKDADAWPPQEVREHWEDVQQYRRRYKNNRMEMIRANANLQFDDHKVETFIPVPWPRELARFSAGLLFSQPPTVINEKHENQINRMLQVNDFGAFALLGGVKVAAEGQGGVRIIRDSSIAPDGTPLITWVDEDQVIWDVRHGAFVVGGTVVITKEKEGDRRDRKDIYRLLETHTPGLVTRKLYKGEQNRLGDPVALSTFEEFAALKPEEPTGLDKPTLVRWQNIPGGESDYFGMGGLFDGFNEAESLLLDRSRKAIPRVFVDKSLSDETGRIEKIDGYIITGGSRLRPTLGKDPGELIKTVEPAFLSREHIEWLDHLSQLIVSVAGYAPETWGIQGKTANVTRAVSGYAIKLAQLRTLLTRNAKQHMALQALGWAVGCTTAWQIGEHDVAACLPIIELGDGMPDDPLDGAQEVLWLRQAMAASTEELVRTLHPAWDDRQVGAEVQKIMDEKALTAGGDLPPTPEGRRQLREILSQAPNDPRAGSGAEPNTPIV